jgi:hypothetical protein
MPPSPLDELKERRARKINVNGTMIDVDDVRAEIFLEQRKKRKKDGA